jgi:uncharacterized protein YbjQ (UPF0145 family)
MIIATTDTIPGHTITSTIGLVQGQTVRARHVGADMMAGLKTIVGGEIKGYSRLLAGAREEALQRMMQAAEAQGANGVVGVRFSTASVMQGAAEILAYGTAVVVE